MLKRFRPMLIGLQLALLGPYASAEVTNLPSIASFFATPQVLDARLSPTGKYLAALVRGENGRVLLGVVDTADTTKLQITAGFNNADISEAYWINDERLYYEISDFSGSTDNLNGNVYAVNRDGSQRTQLISGDWAYDQESTGSHIKRKVLPANYSVQRGAGDGSDDLIVAAWSYNNIDYHAENQRLYRLNSKTLRLSDMLEGAQPDKITKWWLDQHNQPRLAASTSKGRYRIHYRDPSNQQWREIGNFNALANEGFTPYFFDGKGRLTVGKATAEGYAALYHYDLAQGKIDSEPYLKLDGFDFQGEAVIDQASRDLVGLYYTSDADGTAWLLPQLKAIQQKVDAKLPVAVNRISCGNCSNTQSYLVRASSDRQPSTYLLYRPETDELVPLGGMHPDIDPKQMGQRDFFRVPARDGLPIPVYLTLPAEPSKKPRPAVVLVHGGPSVRGGNWEWDDEAQFLASRGYVVIQPEFRGSTGFGFQHFRAGWRQWGLAMQDDLADVAKWAVAQGWVDAKRIAIAGASYGGYATLMGLIKHPEIFRCGFEWAGVTDINLMFSVSWSDVSEQQLRYGMPIMIGDPVKDAAQFLATSPLENAARLRQPLLMAYGGADLRVPIVHGSKFYDAVKRNNPNVEWTVYNDEGHGWSLEKNRIDFWGRVERFLDKNLKAAD